MASGAARAMGGLVLLLAVAACTQTGESRDDDSAAAEPPAARSGPLPRFSTAYKAPFRPFTRCAVRTLAVKRTVNVAYDEAARLARLAAYEIALDRRFVYEIVLRQRPDDVVLAELHVGAVSNLRNWGGEVRRALELCAAATYPPTPPRRPPAESFPTQ